VSCGTLCKGAPDVLLGHNSNIQSVAFGRCCIVESILESIEVFVASCMIPVAMVEVGMVVAAMVVVGMAVAMASAAGFAIHQ